LIRSLLDEAECIEDETSLHEGVYPAAKSVSFSKLDAVLKRLKVYVMFLRETTDDSDAERVCRCFFIDQKDHLFKGHELSKFGFDIPYINMWPKDFGPNERRELASDYLAWSQKNL